MIEPFLFIDNLLEAHSQLLECFVSGRLSLLEAWLGGDVDRPPRARRDGTAVPLKSLFGGVYKNRGLPKRTKEISS